MRRIPMSSLSASLLTEEFPALGPTSRPSSPWSTLSSIFQQRGRPYHNRTRTLSANGSSWSSRIPVLAGLSNRQASYRFYSDIGANDDEIIQEEDIRRRFADPPPTLKELHADGHKMAQGLEDEGTSGIEDDQPFFEQYITEAKECDQELITELNGSLDVLLIFVELLLFCVWTAELTTGFRPVFSLQYWQRSSLNLINYYNPTFKKNLCVHSKL